MTVQEMLMFIRGAVNRRQLKLLEEKIDVHLRDGRFTKREAELLLAEVDRIGKGLPENLKQPEDPLSQIPGLYRILILILIIAAIFLFRKCG